MKIAHAQYKFETIDNIYSNGISLREAYLKAGYDVEDENSWEQNIHNNIFSEWVKVHLRYFIKCIP